MNKKSQTARDREFKSVPPLPKSGDEPLATADAEKERRELESVESQHSRDQRTRKVVGWGMDAIIIMILLVVASALGCLGWHMLAPENWRWLSDDDISDIKSFMLSGALVSVAMNYFHKFIQRQ